MQCLQPTLSFLPMTNTTPITAFAEFPKMARLSRECIITEKIDGTNAQVCITEGSLLIHPNAIAHRFNTESGSDEVMLAGSRTRWITPSDDNFGFARWAQEHSDQLWALGHGRHFGEWWGHGIQRGYNCVKGERYFSLFNVSRWADASARPACCRVVPTIYRGLFSTLEVEQALLELKTRGSVAAPDFYDPEGVIVFHTAAQIGFKKTLKNDDKPKSLSP